MKSWSVWVWLLPLVLFAAAPAAAVSSEGTVPDGLRSYATTGASRTLDLLEPPLEWVTLYALPCVYEIPSCCRRRPTFPMASDWRPIAVFGTVSGLSCRRRQMCAPVPCHEFAAPPNIPIRAGPMAGRSASREA